jgi:RNA polymerase sigma factor (sigma-70 family)
MLLNLFARKHIAKMTDAELILEIKSGKSRLALGELYKRYSHLIFGLGLKYLKNKMEAEDILMQLFEKLEAKIVKSDIKNLKNWLYTVTKNECLMKLRKTNNLSSEIESALLYKEDNSNNLLEEVIVKEQQIEKLELAITQLKDVQQICIELFYIKGKCYDEVVLETGYDLKKVKSYIQNGKRNLKLILENEHVFKS